MRRTAVYRFFDFNHELLYVGITDHLGRRFREHEIKSPWWEMVDTVEVRWYETRVEALEVEQHSIEIEWPIFNLDKHPDQQHNTLRIKLYCQAMGWGE